MVASKAAQMTVYPGAKIKERIEILAALEDRSVNYWVVRELENHPSLRDEAWDGKEPKNV